MDQTRPLGHSNVQKWPNMAPNFPHGSNMTICGWTMGWLKYDEDTFLSVDFFCIHLWEKSFYKETLLPANLMYYSCLVTTANDLTLFTVQFWLGDDVLVFLFWKWCIPWVIGYQYASHLWFINIIIAQLSRSQWTVMCVAIAFFATCLILVSGRFSCFALFENDIN